MRMLLTAVALLFMVSGCAALYHQARIDQQMNMISRAIDSCKVRQCSEEEFNAIETAIQKQRIAIDRRSYRGSYRGSPGYGFLDPVTPNAYGPGINSDGTGRAFIWKPDYGSLPPLGPITPNAYGPGVGMDATGMPVRPSCPPGQVMC